MTAERNGQGSVFDDLPSEVARGWAASATWLVTGDKKTRTIKPEHPLNHGGVGAVELGVRYDSLRVDDDGPERDSRARAAAPATSGPWAARPGRAGCRWWPVEFVRFYGNAVVERYDDPLLAPVPGRKGNYVTLLARLQLSVP